MEATEAAGRPWQSAVFSLARALKAIGPVADAEGDRLGELVRLWHVGRGLPHAAETTLGEFFAAWPKVKHPAGTSPIDKVLARVDRLPLPAVCAKYECPKTHRLIALCRELQWLAGNDSDFFLSVRVVERVIGLDRMTACRRLKVLVAEGVLELRREGTANRAARYRYRGERWERPR